MRPTTIRERLALCAMLLQIDDLSLDYLAADREQLILFAEHHGFDASWLLCGATGREPNTIH
jgi:hypothetical protein